MISICREFKSHALRCNLVTGCSWVCPNRLQFFYRPNMQSTLQTSPRLS